MEIQKKNPSNQNQKTKVEPASQPIFTHVLKWIPDYDCAMADEKLLHLANTEGRILITNDKDFGELTFLQRRLSQGIILFRIKGQSTQDKMRLINVLLQNYRDKLLGRFVVVTSKKIRTVSLEEKEK